MTQLTNSNGNMVLEKGGLATPAQDVRTPSTAGTGITAGVGTVYRQTIVKDGDIIKTSIYVALKGLKSGASAGDIIGVSAAANCHLGQITTAKHGKIFKGAMSCLTVPATGEPDIDVAYGSVATGTQDAAASGLTGYVLGYDHAADYTLQGQTATFASCPAADFYIYLVASGGADNAVYTAGEVLIELWGYSV